MVETKLQKEQSRAKRLKILLKKYEGRIRDHKELAEFKEPVLFLLRNTRKAEFYEDASTGRFAYTHTF